MRHCPWVFSIRIETTVNYNIKIQFSVLAARHITPITFVRDKGMSWENFVYSPILLGMALTFDTLTKLRVQVI